MGDVLHKVTRDYRKSVHTPDYSSDTNWIINPDVSAVAGVAIKYWRANTNPVEEMNAGEKSSVDAAEAQAVTDADRSSCKVQVDLRDLTGIFQVLVDELNVLRGMGQRISLGGNTTLTNVGAAYDTIAAAKGLGVAIVDFTGVSEITFGVFVNKVGTGTQSWQLWNVTNGTEIAVIDDANSAGDKTLQVVVSSGLPTGVKLVRVRAKSTVAADDPVYYGGALVLKYADRTYAQARTSILNRIDSL